jgi:coenzyme F420-reducing hydrogenase alpha subunit
MNDYITAHLFGIMEIIITICAVIGGYFAFKKTQRETIIKFQKETIDSMKDRIDLLESRVEDLAKENYSLKQTLETIKEALKQRGMKVTIDGDLVTISDDQGNHSMRRNARPPTAPPRAKRLSSPLKQQQKEDQ